MPLLFLPVVRAFFSWGEETSSGRTCPPWAVGEQEAFRAELVLPEGRCSVEGIKLPLFETMARLATIPAAQLGELPPSVATWSLASKFALELISRERVVPTIVREQGQLQARWAAALSAGEDAARVSALARSMPPSAHAVVVPDAVASEVWSPDGLLRAYLDAVVDRVLRAARGGPQLPKPKTHRPKTQELTAANSSAPPTWEERWQTALGAQECSFEVQGFAERTVVDEVGRWGLAALGDRERLRACFRLEMPQGDGQAFVLRFLLQSPDDPSLVVDAADVWSTTGRSLAKLGRAFRDPQDSLLEALGRASRVFAPIAAALAHPRPESLELEPAAAWSFLSEGAPGLASAGFGVIVPAELTSAGQRRLRLRMRVGGTSKIDGVVEGTAGLAMGQLLEVDWEAVLGDHTLTARELATLARQKAPLVRHRGVWVAVDPRELQEIRQRISEGRSQLSVREAISAVLAGEAREGQLSTLVTACGSLAQLLQRMREGASDSFTVPETLRATLRPYQVRGLAWLATMGSLGFGGCLADDMGLGKTVQLLAFLLHHARQSPADRRPALLVAPTSVVGNWEREISRFAPSLEVMPHYGSTRARTVEGLGAGRSSLVLTTYGLLRRDAELLASVTWSSVVLDEAQNIKNAASATAGAARRLRASHRFALTGTPVENRLAELWSILEFANPGLLGPREVFRREFAVPIERYGNDQVAERLRRVVGPFVLRRLKRDPAIIADLPAKNEMKVVCTLTREQATLYKAVVDEEMRLIVKAEGITRRGRVLALLMFLKQICNHPAHYLGEAGPLDKRSGKLARTTEMLEEALAAGDKALVFTQFREMGDRLVTHLQGKLGVEVVFLHGATPKKARDEMVRRFQEDRRGPRVFVLSVKAGGTGLNLTAASHVFHYDRWWNPAVEDQATDRAYRIGQRRAVQVHKLLCGGTVEEKVDQLLEQKRALASKIVGTGERWITELGNGELHELFALSEHAVVAADDGDDELVDTSARASTTAPVRGVRRPRPRSAQVLP